MKRHKKIPLGLIVILSLGIVNLTIGRRRPLDHLNRARAEVRTSELPHEVQNRLASERVPDDPAIRALVDEGVASPVE